MIADEVLDELYAAIVLHGDFDAVLRLIAAEFGAHSGCVLLREQDNLRIAASLEVDPEMGRRYNLHYHAFDPLRASAQSLPYGGIVTSNSVYDLQTFERTEFYNEINKLSDIWDTLGLRAGAPGDDINYAVYKPRGSVFSKCEIQKAERLMEHLQRAHRVRRMAVTRLSTRTDAVQKIGLTRAEQKVADHLLKGKRTAEIAEIMGLTAHTINWHVRNIYMKSDVRGRAAFVARFAGSAFED